jgi:hypothetical protein
MARFEGGLPEELIKQFTALEINTEKMLGEMVQAGAEVAKANIKAKMPTAFREGLTDNNIILTKVYKTPSDDGINCQAMISGYFTNHNGKVTPAPLVANMFEYGSSRREYPKQPFFRQSFNKGQIEKAMLKVQEKYIKEG